MTQTGHFFNKLTKGVLNSLTNNCEIESRMQGLVSPQLTQVPGYGNLWFMTIYTKPPTEPFFSQLNNYSNS